MEERKNLISYREEVDLVDFKINPTDDEYCEVLTCLFNNKREEKEIIDLYNCYGNNYITIVVNITEYMKDFEDKQDAISHIKSWLNNFMKDNDINNIDVYEHKGAIYHIDEYGSKVPYENEQGEFIRNYYTED